jgi:hypothetical protein
MHGFIIGARIDFLVRCAALRSAQNFEAISRSKPWHRETRSKIRTRKITRRVQDRAATTVSRSRDTGTTASLDSQFD